jgi:DNA-binding transcriptional regulator YdaS (Cro superfamily)
MKLSAYLEAEKLKPADFAAKLGVHSETVRLWLKGSSRPSNPQYDAIERATGGQVRPDDFRPSGGHPGEHTGHADGQPKSAA